MSRFKVQENRHIKKLKRTFELWYSDVIYGLKYFSIKYNLYKEVKWIIFNSLAGKIRKNSVVLWTYLVMKIVL